MNGLKGHPLRRSLALLWLFLTVVYSFTVSQLTEGVKHLPVTSAGFPSFVQSHFASVNGSFGQAGARVSNTLLNSTPAGNLLLVWVDWDCGPEAQDPGCVGGLREFQGIGDDANNTYHQLDTEHGYLGFMAGSDTVRFYWTVNQTSGIRTVTFNVSSNQGTFSGSAVTEYRGNNPSKPVDSVNFTRYLKSENISRPATSILTTANNCTVVGIAAGSGLVSPGAAAGWALRFQHDGHLFPFTVIDKTFPTPAVATPTWSGTEVQGWGIWSVSIY